MQGCSGRSTAGFNLLVIWPLCCLSLLHVGGVSTSLRAPSVCFSSRKASGTWTILCACGASVDPLLEFSLDAVTDQSRWPLDDSL